jgi:hypothetical protein
MLGTPRQTLISILIAYGIGSVRSFLPGELFSRVGIIVRRAIVGADGSGAPIDGAIDQIHQIENRKRAA